MVKKFKFTNNPTAAKIIYGAVIAILAATAIIVGIVAANSRKDDAPPITENPPLTDGNENGGNNNTEVPPENSENEKEEEKKTTYIAPVSGSVITEHSLTSPVFSETLEEWRVHTGIDISTEESAPVFASADGEISNVYYHPLYGQTVEIAHEGGVVTVYSNLSKEGCPKKGDKVKQGDKIGTVGDTSISELAKEAHLHFEVKLLDASVNPLDYFTEESKEASLGIQT